ncbi:SANT/Myb_domain [Hexamita inflata]|uniref:SANT/Myb_domain n=1 Tax=Hexamita inflata TaxID=28002 RepID=A0ABP1GJU5_9EUKA
MKITQPWTSEDLELLHYLMKKYHTDFRQIAIEMNRTYSQVRSQYYNQHRQPNNHHKKIQPQTANEQNSQDKSSTSRSDQKSSQQDNQNEENYNNENKDDMKQTQQLINELLNFFKQK